MKYSDITHEKQSRGLVSGAARHTHWFYRQAGRQADGHKREIDLRREAAQAEAEAATRAIAIARGAKGG